MSEYIERRVASDKLYNVYEYVKRNIIADGKPVAASLVKNIMLRFEKAINMVPSADVVEVKHGRWEHLGGDEWCCTNCGEVISTEGSWEKPTKKFCNECGAKMDGGADNG